jgi:transcriptional regulator with XRE-family HTH domain
LRVGQSDEEFSNRGEFPSSRVILNPWFKVDQRIKEKRMDLKTARKQKAWSQSDLQERTGVAAHNISALETGSRIMCKQLASRFAEHLDADSAELLIENRIAAMKRAIKETDVSAILMCALSPSHGPSGASLPWAQQIYPHDAGPREGRGLLSGRHAHAAVVDLLDRAVERTRRVRVHIPEVSFLPNPRVRCRLRHAASALSLT